MNDAPNSDAAKDDAPKAGGRILWANVVTVGSVAVLIAVVIVGTGLATGWAISGMLGLGQIGTYVIEALFVGAAVSVVYAFVRGAMRIEPFVER